MNLIDSETADYVKKKRQVLKQYPGLQHLLN